MSSQSNREVEPSHQLESGTQAASPFRSNKIHTTRYTLLNFLPVSFFLQFTKVSNCFYTVNAILQSIPSISTNDPLATIIPLSYVILLGMIKEGIADYKRHKQDKQVNSQPVERLVSKGGKTELETVRSDQLKVGDVIQLKDDDLIPADCFLLTSKNSSGEAFVQTGQLDGERNLKPKRAIKQVQESLFGESPKVLSVDCPPPSADLYYFDGRVKYGDEVFDSDLKQYLHRGAHIKNSGHLNAMVIYTGTETKLVKNQGRYQFKQSHMEKSINYFMGFNIFLILVIGGILAAQSRAFQEKWEDKATYLYDLNTQSSFVTATTAFMSFYLLLNQFVPLELVITLEMAKLWVTSFIEQDATMAYPDFETKEVNKCKVQNLNLHEELGQVNQLFCDKTGTLTQNELVFKRWSCGGKIFENPGQEDKEISDEHRERFTELLRCIVICHDVMQVKLEQENGETINKLSGASQDELNLLEMVQERGLARFIDRGTSKIEVEVLGQKETYEIVKFYDFSSERKAMSIIVKDSEGVAKVYLKGADSSVAERLANKTNDDSKDLANANEFACEGLRTLAFGFKSNLDPESLADRQNIDQSTVENNLNLVGVTGVEDLLQEDVKRCISQFRCAGIRVWMLTGDKKETALQIGLSCGLYDPKTMQILEVNETGNLEVMLTEAEEQVTKKQIKPMKYALSISGGRLPEIYKTPQLAKLIKTVFQKVDSVIVYRSSPSQKAETVKFVRNYSSWSQVTMAIGDGANDVNMIQSAHIGIGILGKEGNQAASFADYALPKYRDLRQLLFWHGRSFGVRATNFTCWFAYKGMLFSIPLIMFNIQAGYSGVTYILDYYFALYEVILTTFAIFFYVSLEVDVDKAFKNPYVGGDYLAQYYGISRDVEITPLFKKFVIWSLYAWYTGTVLYFVGFKAFDTAVMKNGKIDGMWTMGFTSFSILIFIHHINIFIGTRNWQWTTFVTYIFSLACFLPIAVVLNDIVDPSSVMYGTTFSEVFHMPNYWLAQVVACTLIVLPYIFARSLKEVVANPHLYTSVAIAEAKEKVMYVPSKPNQVAAKVLPPTPSTQHSDMVSPKNKVGEEDQEIVEDNMKLQHQENLIPSIQ